MKKYVGCVSDSVTHQILKNGALRETLTHPTYTEIFSEIKYDSYSSDTSHDKLSKLDSAIAFFDPKIGDRGLDRYVVTISNHPEYKVGDILYL
ncbi:MAG: hypothetical protein V7K97_08690 [Nostoc sp.]|uniref:hypothetical protein n=1 Tax=Nostoc sp. TaxID=1180 RepID=UPI002FF796B5